MTMIMLTPLTYCNAEDIFKFEGFELPDGTHAVTVYLNDGKDPISYRVEGDLVQELVNLQARINLAAPPKLLPTIIPPAQQVVF